MDPKSAVVKSKSSNIGVSKSKEDRKPQSNKKTRSNADFPHGPKKRGVYVEKRLAKLSSVSNVQNIDDVTQKPPSRPRAGQKQFLASVFTILSKSTTGTQYPEMNDDTKGINVKNKALKRNKAEDNKVNMRNAREKFKSRVLSKKFIKEDKEKMVVLKSKKEIVQTPSNYSDWSYKDASQSNTFSYLIFDDPNNDDGVDINVAQELKNALLEGRNVKVKRLRYLEEEPNTLVSDAPKVQNNLYNFFVDLLETTISVYNVKGEYDNASETSKTVLQINESVADKLNIDENKTIPHDEVIVNPQFIDIEYESDKDHVNFDTKPITMKLAEFKTGKRKRLKADSFIHVIKKFIPKSKSLEMNRKTMFKNKKDLINLLKQQLEIETRVFEEPRSIFQALKLMARNKKRITFDPSIEHKSFTDECILKRRKVISSRRAKKNKNTNEVFDNNIFRPKTSFNKTDYKNDYRRKIKAATDNRRKMPNRVDNKDSYQSLEVYGYDYESKQPEMYLNKSKDVTFTYHSTPTTSELDFDVNDAILNPTSLVSENYLPQFEKM